MSGYGKLPLNQVTLFGNSAIIFDKSPMFYKTFAKSNYLTLSDIWDTNANDFISDQKMLSTLKDKRNWISEWSRLKLGIQKSVFFPKKDALNQETGSHLKFNFQNLFISVRDKTNININELKIKDIVGVFHKNTPKHIPSIPKWELFFNRSFCWKNIWSTIYKSYASAKAKQLASFWIQTSC